MTDYRTPEQEQATREQDARIQGVLDQAVRDGGSLMAAIQLDEPADVVEMWISRLYGGLRALEDDRPCDFNLRNDEPLRAIVLLLTDRITEEAASIIRQIKQVAE